eukprot:scaffold2391_cov381-Prasinococcus_capsulatus_cf.AAC.3
MAFVAAFFQCAPAGTRAKACTYHPRRHPGQATPPRQLALWPWSAPYTAERLPFRGRVPPGRAPQPRLVCRPPGACRRAAWVIARNGLGVALARGSGLPSR